MTFTHTPSPRDRTSERGNVLFLILIAVALFAALSYAVTQSTRSGGGDASKETNLVNAAQITQYPASIKTAITRMIISNSIDPKDLLFDTPSTFDSANIDTDVDLQRLAVFYPTGGGASYVAAPNSVMNTGTGATNTSGTWHFNGENRVLNVGLTGTTLSVDDADIIAFLPDVKKAVCDSIHDKLGISKTYTTVSGIDFLTDMDEAKSLPRLAAGGGTITLANVLDGQPQGCFNDGDIYVYYHVVAER